MIEITQIPVILARRRFSDARRGQLRLAANARRPIESSRGRADASRCSVFGPGASARGLSGGLEKAGLVTSERVGQTDRPDRKVYELTVAGRERVMEWLRDTNWPKPAPAEFHLKLVAAAAAGLADPVRLVDAQRHALLAGLGAAQRAALAEPEGSVAGLLLEGVVLRQQADLRWLEACAEYWSTTKERS